LIDRIEASGRNLRDFGLLFGLLGSVAGVYFFWRGSVAGPYLFASGLIFLSLGLFFRSPLKPLYVGWMSFAHLLGWINTRLLLGLFYYLVLTPIGLILRLAGKDLLHERLDRTAGSYWTEPEKHPPGPEQYRRLF
jgi:hypothetical protein